MAKDDWKRERDERLAKLGLHGDDDVGEGPHCVHCGQPFNPHLSAGGEFGICQSCIDD